LSELSAAQGSEALAGEVVIVVEGAEIPRQWSKDEVLQALKAGLARGEKLKAISVKIAKAARWPSSEVYRAGLLMKAEEE
jgi:16S rRNA (cytidine1402-2'-O)-methyltransferase